jgi:hypothetical protein
MSTVQPQWDICHLPSLTARNWPRRFEHSFRPETLLESFRLVFSPAKYVHPCGGPTDRPTFDQTALSPKSKQLRILYDDFQMDAVRCQFRMIGARGGQLVETLRYKPKGHGFLSLWCHWNFSVT